MAVRRFLPICSLVLVSIACRRTEANAHAVTPGLTTSAAASSPQPSVETPNIVHISAYRDGTLSFEGNKVSADELIHTLEGLDPAQTIVWYYREAAKEAPHPDVQRVVRAISDNGFPVSLSTQADFSDVVDPDGKSRPRHF